MNDSFNLVRNTWLGIFAFMLVSALSLVHSAECMDDYDRHAFKHWVDIDGDGLDARQQAIWSQIITNPNTGEKIGGVERGRVVWGLMHDPYTGEIISIADEAPDADHVIPLKAAFDRGANCWGDEKRKRFANDPLNLVATKAGANRQKGAKLLFDWLPNRVGFCSDYLDQMVKVQAKYGLVPTDEDIRAYQFWLPKCEAWQKGIKLKDVRGWFAKHFGWSYQ